MTPTTHAADGMPQLPEPRYYWEPAPDSGLSKSSAGWSTNTGPAPGWTVTHYYPSEQVHTVRQHAAALQAEVEGLRAAVSYDAIYDLVRGTGYVTRGQADEIATAICAALANEQPQGE